ncbi:arsenate reductase ArsC [Marinomonas posidonica]|uniref:Protein tyrosine phosphatase n=1 Tax=Marinomonas posidonica (strain CECT 7376 / NCIMB 14433 / IVIA-Po-181) TaxID=491952 RepID=F6CYD2_MARPP|nr:arsenate reductase ArsC [Marinomonas posidonica]AEF53459.1 protein tyrosine phosphatase [Marinomonas posidonica IVIA-Po-181]
MKILYICTHNRCRSILSEAITNGMAAGLIEAKSAGSQPVGEVHPLSLKYLKQAGYQTAGLISQSWDDFEDFEPDLVITVCDSAAGEACPLYFGKSLKVHWGLSDPSKLEGSDTQQETAFMDTIKAIEERVEQLKALAQRRLDAEQLKFELSILGAK